MRRRRKRKKRQGRRGSDLCREWRAVLPPCRGRGVVPHTVCCGECAQALTGARGRGSRIGSCQELETPPARCGGVVMPPWLPAIMLCRGTQASQRVRTGQCSCVNAVCAHAGLSPLPLGENGKSRAHLEWCWLSTGSPGAGAQLAARTKQLVASIAYAPCPGIRALSWD